jgi:glycosyltransferase involved in cell wall biosynthesis
MRILLMSDTPRDPNSGAAGTEVQTSDAMRTAGHIVDEVWETQLGRRIRHGNLHYLLELPRAYKRETRRAFAKAQYDVVHVNQPHGFLAAEWLAKHHPNVPFVHRSHGLELRAERDLAPWRNDDRSLPRRLATNALAPWLRRHTYRTVKAAWGHIVYVTEDRDFLVSELGVDERRVAVIAAAAPSAMIETPAPPMTAGRLRNIVYVSQFAFFKAPGVVVEAMNQLAARHDDLHFTWVCDARHHDAVRALLNAKVELMPWVPQDELRSIYDRAGIFLFPSYYEGFGKVFIEAMARGAVVIATNVAGARDVIDHGTDGMLVAPGDASAIVRCAEELLAYPERAIAMSQAAAAKARTYTWARVAREAVDFYERLKTMGPVRR